MGAPAGRNALRPLLERGRAAFGRRDWTTARDCYAAAVEIEPSADSLDGLGRSRWWLGDAAGALGPLEQAAELYERESRAAEAADVAIFLAGEHRIAQNASIANGWLERGRRLLAQCGPCPAQSWLHIELSKCAASAGEVEEEAARALAAAREVGDRALEACALAHEGVGRIGHGDVDGGLAVMDEAMAIALSAASGDALAVCDAACTVLMACERVADPVRARDWARTITEFVRRNNFLP